MVPLPETPVCLTMLRPNKFAFYGGPQILQMARAAPDIHWIVVAHDGAGLPRMSNVEYLGYVDDMGSVYRRTTVLVRLTAHDGTGVMPIEALARGRHVVWSHRLPHCHYARTAQQALPAIRAAARSGLNLAGAVYVREEFNVARHTRRLLRIYRAVACLT